MDEPDKITLEVAKMIREAFLQQNIFSSYDRYCPFYKTFWMLRNMITFHDLAQRTVQQSSGGKPVTWTFIRKSIGKLIYNISCMKFQEPSNGEQQVVVHMKALNEEIISTFRDLRE